jgi:predicted porin
MKKKLIALAVAVATSGAAFAQSNVTIYGNIDVGFMNRWGDNGAVPNVKSQNDIQSAASESYIGFKGVEDLGNGLKAVFDMAYLVSPDTNGGMTKSARQYVGLTGGFGTVVAGDLDGLRYGIYGRYDPFGNYSVGALQQQTIQIDRGQNAVGYISPTFSGFNLILAHATAIQKQEGTTAGCAASAGGNNCDDRLYSVNVNYNNGPLSVALDYETVTTVGTSNGRLYVATAGASYDFGVAKVGVLIDRLHGDTNSLIGATNNQDSYLLGVTVPFGKTSVLGSFGFVKDKDRSDADAKKYSLGVRYALSKRTTAYADYSHVSNDSNAAFEINPLGNSRVNQGAVGVNGLAIGLKHSF